MFSSFGYWYFVSGFIMETNHCVSQKVELSNILLKGISINFLKCFAHCQDTSVLLQYTLLPCSDPWSKSITEYAIVHIWLILDVRWQDHLWCLALHLRIIICKWIMCSAFEFLSTNPVNHFYMSITYFFNLPKNLMLILCFNNFTTFFTNQILPQQNL